MNWYRSSKARKSEKRRKPYPDFRLFAGDTGRWAKKVGGLSAFTLRL